MHLTKVAVRYHKAAGYQSCPLYQLMSGPANPDEWPTPQVSLAFVASIQDSETQIGESYNPNRSRFLKRIDIS